MRRNVVELSKTYYLQWDISTYTIKKGRWTKRDWQTQISYCVRNRGKGCAYTGDLGGIDTTQEGGKCYDGPEEDRFKYKYLFAGSDDTAHVGSQ